ncbi:MAG: DUF4180 domain-containing protein [Spirochaetes bacterium]|nr:DUF4180 domain-containing protein [Spirochaetota bacterium]
MNVVIRESNGKTIAEIQSQGVIIGSSQDALDVMADLGARGIRELILHQQNIAPAFFRLSTGLAGDILQKFSNYQVRAAIVGDFERFTSGSLHAFIRESNRGGAILFVSAVEEALRRLGG